MGGIERDGRIPMRTEPAIPEPQASNNILPVPPSEMMLEVGAYCLSSLAQNVVARLSIIRNLK